MSEYEVLLIVAVFLASVVLGFCNASNNSANSSEARPGHGAMVRKINKY